MAEIIFDCPACKQPVQADDAWAGQEIQCPLCHSPMIVPQAQSHGGPAGETPHFTGRGLVEVPKETKLKAGPTQTTRSASGSGPVIRNFQPTKGKGQNPVVKYATAAVILLALAAGAWFGWPYLKPHLAFLNKGSENTAATETGTNGTTTAVEPTTPPPVKEAPMMPPIYTLDVAQAKFTEGKVNGTITGTNFVPDSVRLEKLPGFYVLDMRQGIWATPDRGLRVYLRLGSTNTPAGQTYTVSPEMKGTPVSQLVKTWKTNPKYAAQEKSFSTGFALKLEFGQMTESNTISGKIFAALPDKEQTVVAGVFHTGTAVSGAPGVAAQQAETPQQIESKADFQKRYGTRR